MKQHNEEVKQRTAVFPEKTKKTSKRGLWIFLGILVVLGLFVLLMGMGQSGESGHVEGEPYVALIYVVWEIIYSNYDYL